MSRQRLNARGWAIRQMRASVGGSRSVGGCAWGAAILAAVERRPYQRVASPYVEGLGFLRGEAAFFAWYFTNCNK